MNHQVKKHFYVLVRKDIPLPQQIVQSIHAAYESAGKFDDDTSQTYSTVLCQVSNETDLMKAARKLDSSGIRYHIFKEPDINYESTALCTEPVEPGSRRAFSNWKLWKE